MAIRYIAFARKDATRFHLASNALDDGFNEVHRSANLIVLANCPTITLANNSGVIVGHLFDKLDSRRIYGLTAEQSRDITETEGSSLIDKYWGGYVALISTHSGECVVRDPSGIMPCFTRHEAGGLLIASDMATLKSAMSGRLTVDWNGLLMELGSNDFKRKETALIGVHEVLAGHRLNISTGQTTPVWSPWDFTEPSRLSEVEVVENLREVINTTLGAWASCYDAIGVSLSGGLDSSIVTASLKDQAQKLTLLNMATDEGEGDERHYARLAAGMVRRPLLETFYDVEDIDFKKASSGHLPRPSLNVLAQADMAIKIRVEQSHGLDAWFSGLGGDNVFCIMFSTTPVLDRYHVQGLFKALKTLNDVIDLTGCSFWQALGQMRQTVISFPGRYLWRSDTCFLNRNRSDHKPLTFEHPWLNAPKQALIGKIAHVAMLLRAQPLLEGFPRTGAPLINPLLSQPIVEACLAIPTWHWCAGGQNRSVARRAYSSTLPQALTNRRSKGGPNSFAFTVLQAQRTQIQNRLLNGLLAKNGVLDIEGLATAFNGSSPMPAETYFRLAALLEAENWAREWSS